MCYDFARLYPYSNSDAARAFHEIWITIHGNNSPVMEFAGTLDEETYWRLRQLLVKTANEGKIRNPEMYKHIGDGIYEFKARTARVFSFNDGRRVVLTHGGERADRAVKERKQAKRVETEYLAWKGRKK